MVYRSGFAESAPLQVRACIHASCGNQKLRLSGPFCRQFRLVGDFFIRRAPEDFDANQTHGRPSRYCDGRSELRVLPMRTIFTALTALFIFIASCPGWGQQGGSADDVLKGRELAILVCANCHVAASSQPFEPILQLPAPSFESIAQRKNIDADWVQSFLATTHRGLDNPNGMPNPRLLDSQIKQMAAYLLSLPKNP